MVRFYLYKITNLLNQKVYIGVTSRPEERFKQHLSKYSTCTKLRNSIQKNGAENFQYSILCVGEQEYILDLEKKAITAYDSINNGYNLIWGNPRTGDTLLSQEVKSKISEGLNKYHSKNIAWNHGIKIGLRKQYDPHYVSGFWFPHLEVAAEKLGVTTTQLRRLRVKGTLGNTAKLRKDSLESPCYVAGFWFKTLSQAEMYLNVPRKTLAKRIKDGNVEQESRKFANRVIGEQNPMFGKTGFAHHNSKAVSIDGVVYGSIAEATRLSKYTKKMIYNRLKNKTEGFFYLEPNQ